MVSGPGRGEEHRRRRCKYTTGENVHKEGWKTEQGDAKVRPQYGERRGEEGRHGGGSHERQPRAESEVGVAGEGARRGRGRDSRRRRAPRPTRKGGQGDPDRQRREKGETRYFSPRMPPLSVLHAGGEYLGVVANIITQADEAGFELLGTQRAGVILGPPCARQRAMRCQGGGGREGRGWAMPQGKGSVCGETQGQRHADEEGGQWTGWGRKGNKSAHG